MTDAEPGSGEASHAYADCKSDTFPIIVSYRSEAESEMLQLVEALTAAFGAGQQRHMCARACVRAHWCVCMAVCIFCFFANM